MAHISKLISIYDSLEILISETTIASSIFRLAITTTSNNSDRYVNNPTFRKLSNVLYNVDKALNLLTSSQTEDFNTKKILVSKLEGIYSSLNKILHSASEIKTSIQLRIWKEYDINPNFTHISNLKDFYDLISVLINNIYSFNYIRYSALNSEINKIDEIDEIDEVPNKYSIEATNRYFDSYYDKLT